MKSDKSFILAAILEIFPEKQPDIDLINELFYGGLDLLYLRPASKEQIDWAAILNKIDSAFQKKLILPVLIAEEQLCLASIHHWKEVERKEGRTAKDSSDLVCSTSVHNLSDVYKLPACFNYVFYSPIFPSITKLGYVPQLEITEVKKELTQLKEERANLPLVIGLGGIKASNIKQVKDAGLDGAALMGALWQSPDPIKMFLEIKNAVIV